MKVYLLSDKNYELINLEEVNKSLVDILLSNFHFLEGHNGLGLDNIIKKESALKILKENFCSLTRKDKHLEKIKAFVRKIDTNSHFIISKKEFSPYHFPIYRLCIQYANEGKNPVEGFVFLLKNIKKRNDIYESLGWGYLDNQRIYIGEPNKTKRICRFCSKSQPKVTFITEAHAISKSVGNKTLICNEECDVCNGIFGENEQNFSKYMHIMSAMASNEEWDGLVEINGFIYDIQIIYDEKGERTIKISNREGSPSLVKGEKYNIHLFKDEPVILSKVYKSFVKYTLSLLPNEYLTHLKKTIEWIKSDKASGIQLPYIYRTIGHQVSHPFLICHLRKDKSDKYPYCICELHCFDMIFIYAIPYSDRDDSKALKDNMQNYMDKYCSDLKLVVEDFNTDIPKIIRTDMGIDLNSK